MEDNVTQLAGAGLINQSEFEQDDLDAINERLTQAEVDMLISLRHEDKLPALMLTKAPHLLGFIL